MSSSPAISVKKVHKSFRVHSRKDGTVLSRLADLLPSGSKRHHTSDIHAVNDVSFELAKGEVLGVVGRNASGKTTLLRLLAGIHTPDSGTIETEGKIISLLNVSAGIKDRLSLRDNVFLVCALYGMHNDNIMAVFPPIMKFAELENSTEMYPYQLSKGMKQRLALSIALHMHSDILLLDEVFSAGDRAFQRKAVQKMRCLIKSDVTVVIVSHNLNHIKNLCDKAVWIDKGSLRVIGDTEYVLECYKRMYVVQSGIPLPKIIEKKSRDVSPIDIMVTGTGRSGTTFLTRLFLQAGYDCGNLSLDSIGKQNKPVGGGLEHLGFNKVNNAIRKDLSENKSIAEIADSREEEMKGPWPAVVKNPAFLATWPVWEKANIRPRHMFLCVRDHKATMKSAEQTTTWNTKNLSMLYLRFHKIFLYCLSQDIPYTVVHYPRIGQDQEYAERILSPFFNDPWELVSKNWDESLLHFEDTKELQVTL